MNLKTKKFKSKSFIKFNLAPSKKTPKEMIAYFKKRFSEVKKRKSEFSQEKKIQKKKFGEIDSLKTISKKVKRLELEANNLDSTHNLTLKQEMNNRALSKISEDDSKWIHITMKNNKKIPIESLIFNKHSQLVKKIAVLEKLIPGYTSQRHYHFQLDDLDLDTASERTLMHFKFLKDDGYVVLGNLFKSATERVKVFREKYDNVIKEEVKLVHNKIRYVKKIFFF